MHEAVIFNLFGGVEPQGSIAVAQGTPVQISAQEIQSMLLIAAFV